VRLAEGKVVLVHALDASPAGDRPPLTVVCVHGNPTWSVLWRSFHRRLGDRYRVLAIDHISMGLSQRTKPRRFAQRVDDLGRILDAFAVDGPVVLAAHDWGGPIALGWALEHREQVQGILLANTGVAIPPEGVPPLIRLARHDLVRDTACRRTSLFLRGTLATAHGRLSKGARAAYLAPYRDAADRQAIADFVADIPTRPAHPSAPALAAVAARLPDLDVPVLLAWGERDPVFHLGFARDLRLRLPHAEMHRFPLAGHLVVEEEDVAALADAWIDRVLRPEPATPPPGPEGDEVALWDALVARERDASTALVAGDGRALSFARLASRIAAIAEGLRSAGVAPGDRVAVLTPEPTDFIPAAYACWVSGAVAVVVDRGLGTKGLRRALRSAEPNWLLGTRTTLAAARALRWVPGARALDVAGLRGTGAPLSGVVSRLAPRSNVLGAVVFTSGATGPAKGVLYDQRTMAAQFSAVKERYAIDADDRLVAAFAPFALYGPALGIPVAVPDCDITKPASLRADSLADACAAVDATILFAAPAALEGVLGSARALDAAGSAALARLRLVLSAGAPVPQSTLEEFQKLAPAARLHTPYGMTEVLSVTDIALQGLRDVGQGRGVCVGSPLRGVQLAIEPLARGHDSCGEILVSAPWLSQGYDGLWATNERARSIDAGGRSWHRTGDVGHLDPDGLLWIEGRLAHVVFTAEGPVAPVPLENAVTAATGMRSALTGVGPEGCAQVVVVVERDGKAGLAPPELDRSVRAAAPGQRVAAVLTVPKLPVDIRHNSKVDRTRLGRFASALLAGGTAPRGV
jgi:acyl-coenzyme A synthetase/AMP-(fatty) acid ligase/pimeloyl-ACP methyl ester carboxylesterase